jgi:hypothetical protein
MYKLLEHFHDLGNEYHLTFSIRQVLNNCLLGLDPARRKILVVTSEDDMFYSFVIDLNNVRHFSVRKVYGTIEAGDLNNGRLEQYLKKIVLHFELDGRPSVDIVFYHNRENNFYEIQDLEQSAKHWEAILTNLQTPLRKIAV